MSVGFSKFLGGLGRFLIGLGIVILAFAAFQLWGTGFQESRAQSNLESEFSQKLAEIQAEQDLSLIHI